MRDDILLNPFKNTGEKPVFLLSDVFRDMLHQPAIIQKLLGNYS